MGKVETKLSIDYTLLKLGQMVNFVQNSSFPHLCPFSARDFVDNLN